MADRLPPYTINDLAEFIALPENQARLFELIDGEIVEKIPTEKQSDLGVWVASLLLDFVRPRKLGRVSVEVRHQADADQENSFLLDVSFSSDERANMERGGVLPMPDLAVEIRSPNDKLRYLMNRAYYFMRSGTRSVWIMDYMKRLVIVLTPDDEDILTENEMLDGGDVLPGFKVLVKDIFADPLVD